MSSCFSAQERVGNFLADFYSVNGLVLESRKRREHLSEEDILRNKAIMESLSKGGSISEHNFEVRKNSALLLYLALAHNNAVLRIVNMLLTGVFLCPACQKAIAHSSCAQHNFLGRIHHSRAWKVSILFLFPAISLLVVWMMKLQKKRFLQNKKKSFLKFIWTIMDHKKQRLCMFLTLRPPHLGRELVCKESKKNFKATVAMSQDFPLGIES